MLVIPFILCRETLFLPLLLFLLFPLSIQLVLFFLFLLCFLFFLFLSLFVRNQMALSILFLFAMGGLGASLSLGPAPRASARSARATTPGNSGNNLRSGLCRHWLRQISRPGRPKVAGNGAPGEALGGSISPRNRRFSGPDSQFFFPSRGGSICPTQLFLGGNGGFRGLFFSKMEWYFWAAEGRLWGGSGGPKAPLSKAYALYHLAPPLLHRAFPK